MIQIDKSQTPVPGILATGRGYRETQRLKNNYDSGIRKFSFHRKIYGHDDVKNSLKRLQYHKCCFCEARITHVSYGDTEHFRPKAEYRGSDNQSNKPGYYWLAYDFSNLFLACELCNRSGKKNYFPLVNENTRARSHHDDYRKEKNLLE